MQNSDTEVLKTAVEWLENGHSLELVTLVQTWGSAPRPVGSLAAVRDDGILIGSVSGGCVEKQLTARLPREQKPRIVQHEVSHEQALRFGLPCGGSLKLVFEYFEEAAPLREILENLEIYSMVSRTINLDTGVSSIRSANTNERFCFNGVELTKVFGPGWRLLLIGAGQLSRFVAEMAIGLDYNVAICEPRESFANAWKVPGTTIDSRSPDDVVKEVSTDSRCAVLALTHDPNLDDLALMEALIGDVFYVGALGSRRSAEKRLKRLQFLGLNETQLKKLHGPIGLKIGSKTPAEIAISILAEVIAVRKGLPA